MGRVGSATANPAAALVAIARAGVGEDTAWPAVAVGACLSLEVLLQPETIAIVTREIMHRKDFIFGSLLLGNGKGLRVLARNGRLIYHQSERGTMVRQDKDKDCARIEPVAFQIRRLPR